MANAPDTGGREKHWLLRPENIRRLTWLAVAILAVIALLDFAIGRYAAFGIDGTVFFYSWYGFATCVAMVVLAKLAGIFVKRKDSYYDD
jgi:uncharacterized membrane protein